MKMTLQDKLNGLDKKWGKMLEGQTDGAIIGHLILLETGRAEEAYDHYKLICIRKDGPQPYDVWLKDLREIYRLLMGLDTVPDFPTLK